MKKGYILLTDTGTLFTRIIKLFTKQPYNHASIAFDAELRDVYSFGRKELNNPFVGGFVREDVRSKLFSRAKAAIYSFEATDEEWRKMQHIIGEMKEKQHKYCYHFGGLFGFIQNKPVEKEDAYFCSQFVATVLESSGITSFTKPTALIAPHDLAEIPRLTLEFEGSLQDYLQEETLQLAYC